MSKLVLLAKEDQDVFERFVFRVLDVNHKDYQVALEGFVEICNLADQARFLLADQGGEDETVKEAE